MRVSTRALLAAALLAGCNRAPAPAPSPGADVGPRLETLAADARKWAARGQVVLDRPWAAQIDFPKRLLARVRALDALAREATAEDLDPDAAEALLARGHKLVYENKPFDTALRLVEAVGSSVDQIQSRGELIELHMPPLETHGEAPFRIRIQNARDQEALAIKHLDEALTKILAQEEDAALHANIATQNLRQALETMAKLYEEVKAASTLASSATHRQKLLEDRITWARKIAAKLGDALPPEARSALDAARALAAALPPETADVLRLVRNAQPGAESRATDLGTRTDAVIEPLTRLFLPLGRETGVGEPH